MLHENIILFAKLIVALWCTIAQHVDTVVVASLKSLSFIALAIADKVIDTQVLLPDSVLEQDYFLRPSDIKRIQNVELVVWIGPEIEAVMAKPVKRLAAQKRLTIAELSEVSLLLIKSSADDHHNQDHEHHYTDGDIDRCHSEYNNMHLWLSPEIAWLSAVAIHGKLAGIISQSRAKLDANLKDFKEQLTAIDKKVSNELVPLKGKRHFVFHDVYSYYEKHYGLTPFGHFFFNSEIQPGAQSLHEIRTQLVQQKAICVFVEPQFRSVIIESIARGAPVRIGSLDPLGANIQLSKHSYATFLGQLANQYTNCLKGE